MHLSIRSWGWSTCGSRCPYLPLPTQSPAPLNRPGRTAPITRGHENHYAQVMRVFKKAANLFLCRRRAWEGLRSDWTPRWSREPRPKSETWKGSCSVVFSPKIGWPAKNKCHDLQTRGLGASCTDGGPWWVFEQWNLILRLSLNFLPFIQPSLACPSTGGCLQIM